jgi:Tfp pilus assembly protein PilV
MKEKTILNNIKTSIGNCKLKFDNYMQNMVGQSLFEVVFTVAIIALVLTGITSVAVVSVRNASFSDNNAQATRYAQETTELRAERDGDWSAFLTNVGSNSPSFTYCFDSLGWSNVDSCTATETIGSTIFIRDVEFSCWEFDPGPPPTFPTIDCDETSVANVQADISVSWVDAQGTHTVDNAARYTSWRQ